MKFWNNPKILVTIIIVFMFAFGLTMNQLIKINNQCVQDPFVYGAQKVAEDISPLQCTCSFDDSRYDDFVFDEEGVKQIKKPQLIPNLPNYDLDIDLKPS